MWGIKVIHTLLVLIGVTLGFNSSGEQFDEPMPWLLLLFVPFVAFLSSVVFMSFVVWLSCESLYSYIYWYSWLSAVLMFGVGIGLALKSVYIGHFAATYVLETKVGWARETRDRQGAGICSFVV